MLSEPICLRVKGPFACFTRPEFHVERVSYPVITPSAARGILEAILMKPIEKPEAGKRGNKMGFRWHILRLGIMRKGVLVSILRNELGYASHPAYGNTQGYDIMDQRTQRHSLLLRDVEYLIEAVIEVAQVGRRTQTNAQGLRPSEEFLARNKYHQMFLRRAAVGQCFYQPFLGCREFSASEWELVEPAKTKPDISINDDFGVVFRDFDFDPAWNHWGDVAGKPRPTSGWNQPGKRPEAQLPLHAKAEQGWIRVNEISNGKVVAA